MTDLFDGSSEHRVRIELEVDPDRLEAMEESPDLVYAAFGDLLGRMPLSTMNTFDAEGRLQRIEHAHEAVRSHARLRIETYARRRAHQIDAKARELEGLREKLRFVTLVVAGDLVIGGRPLGDVCGDLERLGFRPRQGQGEEAGSAFDHLLRMTLASITAERAEALRREVARAEAELAALEASTEFGTWRRELEEFRAAYATYLAEKAARQGDTSAVTRGKAPKKRAKRGKKKA